MAPKGRKSLSLWYECESCHVILQSKDTETHSLTSCPPSVEEWTQSFIKDKALYSYVEEGKLQDIAGSLSDSDREELVLLSQSALQLCGMVIGEPVMVTIEGHTEVKLAWPTAERTLTSVLLSARALEHGWESAQGRVIVMKLKSIPMPAKEISLQFEGGQDAQNDDRVCLLNLISHRYQGKMVRVGSRISIPFYGRHMRLRVKSVEPFEAAPAGHLEEAFQCLSLDAGTLAFYKAIGSTNWTFVPDDACSDGKKEPCKVTLANVGGYLNVINDLKETISYSLGCRPAIPGVPASFGVLLYGVHGTGKSLLAQALANESQANVFSIQSGDLFSKYYGETESRLRQIFCEAKRNAPSVLILDDVETICPKRGTDQERRVVAALLSQLDSLCGQRMVVLATTSLPEALDPGLRRPGRLDREVELPVPTADDRVDILNKLLADTELVGSPVLVEVGTAAYGFVGADLAAIVARANAAAAFAMCRTLLPEHLLAALCQVKPSAMREVLIQVPNVHWEDIGGQEDLKLKLRQAVEWPLRHPEAFLRLGITPPRGLLMFGPPGCSKTMIAKALATESKLNFLSIKGGELFSKWVGESERAVSELFRRARSVAPAIVFLDEVDAVSGVRGSSGEGGSSVQERVLAQLLTEMDGVQTLTGVTVVAATNRPDRIDKALLRPGRLDRLIYVPLPDKATRMQILQIQLRKMPVTEEILIEELAASTENYSGAEVVAVCHEAALKALEKDLCAEVVTRNDFQEALRIVTPRTPFDLLQLYDKYCR